MAPDTGKDVVKLNIDGGKGQEPCHRHLSRRLPEPGQWGNLPRELCRPTRGCIFLLAVFGSDATQNRQREGHQGPDDDNDANSAERKGLSTALDPGNGVENREHTQQGPAEQHADK